MYFECDDKKKCFNLISMPADLLRFRKLRTSRNAICYSRFPDRDQNQYHAEREKNTQKIAKTPVHRLYLIIAYSRITSFGRAGGCLSCAFMIFIQ